MRRKYVRVSFSLVFSLLLSLLLLLAAALPAAARDTEVMLPAEAAANSEKGRTFLSEIPFYMKGQKHPAVAKELMTVSTQQSTRGAFRSDEDSCNTAFLTALKVLQDRASTEGGNAIVDVVSITRDRLTEDATNFRCVAGSMVVHVGLKARIVKLK